MPAKSAAKATESPKPTATAKAAKAPAAKTEKPAKSAADKSSDKASSKTAEPAAEKSADKSAAKAAPAQPVATVAATADKPAKAEKPAKGAKAEKPAEAAVAPEAPADDAPKAAKKPEAGAKVAAKAPEAFKPKPVKPVKAPPVNPDDPFEGIDELSEAQFLWQQIEVLKEERAKFAAQSEMLRAEADQLAIDMEPGDVQFDDESGEGATVSIERERDLAMSANAAATVDDIDRALASIETGFYGYCETCHTAIRRDRLRAMPFATQCVACKSGGLSRR